MATAVGLGTAETFGVLAGAVVFNTGATTITGDLGVSPGSAVTGFPPGLVIGGTVHAADAVALQAQADVSSAYDALAGQVCNVDFSGQDLGGLTLVPGVYCFSTSALLTGTLTLDGQGNPAAVFVFQIAGTLDTADNASVLSINGTQDGNVYWQVAGSAEIKTGTTFVGNILGLTSIQLGTGASLVGRALARTGSVVLDTNSVVVPVVFGSPLVVTTTADVVDANDGFVSLREAINFANSHANSLNPGGAADTIGFNIPGAGVHTISTTSDQFGLAISDPVVIDGYTQPGAVPNTSLSGFNGTLLIELNGENAGTSNGLDITAGNSTVRGLIINRFQLNEGNAIRLLNGNGNLIEGNFIGTDATGTLALANENSGIAILSSLNNTIGGTTPEARNVISGNALAFFILTSGNTIQGNLIGTQKDGVSPLGNTNGVAFGGVGGANNNLIGGTVPGAGNVIAFTTTSFGIAMESASGTGNAFLGNSIFSNARLGIDLAANDVTPNDVGDSDAGANNQQNFPEIIAVGVIGGSTIINGKFNSTPSTNGFRVEFFASVANDPTDHGEGQTLLGFTTVDTDVNGNATFSVTLPLAVPSGQFITATATDPSNNTSEFSGIYEVPASCLTVTNTADSGAGSLRDAIDCANSTLGTDMISFNIPGSGVKTISPTAALPIISDPIIIDGYTQPGASANTLAIGNDSVHLIELNGVNQNFSGLVIGPTGGGSTIHGLVINRFSFGIVVNSGNNVIDGNFIGIDPAGNTALGNSVGVHVTTGVNNLIGGTTPPARNVISANVAGGVGNVFVDGITNFQGVPTAPFPSGTLIRGNYIGTNAAGLAAFFAGDFGNNDGVVVVRSTGTIIGGSDADDTSLDGNVGARNVIAGNVDGIHTEEAGTTYAADITVQGNFIGVNATGNVALGNFGNGIFFSPQRERSDNFITVGGTAAGAGNVISGNTAVGVVIANSNVMMQGNRIGTNLAGTLDLGNGNAGVELTRGGSPPFPVVQFTVGGATPAARNIISGNGGFGLRVNNLSGSATVQGNYIGTLGDGISPLGNDSDGIFAQEAAGGGTIGGTSIGEGNVIAFNGGGIFGGAGINIPSAAGITILGNAIFSNRGLGIDLFGNGITPNDPPANKDSDIGPNNLQNFPVITSVAGNVISATLNSLSSSIFRIEFFASDAADATGFGEGQTFLGSTLQTTDVDGNTGPFTFDASPTAIAGKFISATATRRSVSGPAFETSEFSAVFATQAVGAAVTINQAAGQADPTSSSPILFTVVFSEAVSGFTGSDVSFAGSTVGGALVANVSGGGANYTVSVTGMTGNGTVVVSIPAAAAVNDSNNPSAASTSIDNTVTFSTPVVAPTVTINQAMGQADPTSNSPIQFAVVFSTPVTDFTADDLAFTGSTLGSLLASVSGSGANYTVSVQGMTGNGTVVASIAAGAAVDASNNPSAASTSTDNTVTFTTPVVAPTVTINQAAGQADPTSSSPILFTVVFSAPVTGFTGSDVSFAGSTVGGTLVASVSGSGANYTVSVTGMTGNGTVVASIAAAAAIDGGNTPSAASTSTDNTVTFTTPVVAPTVTINQAAGQADPTSTGPVQFTVVFSTPVTGFIGSDVSFAGSTVGGALVAGVSGSGANYTVSVTGMTGGGMVVASIGSGAAVNAGNTSSAASTSTDNTVMVTVPVPQATTLTITLVARQAKFKNEFGLYFVDDAAGRIGTLAPGDRGYARAAISRTKAVFTTRDKIGAKRTVNLPAGGFYGTYLVQNATRSQFLARNPFNRINRKPLMFFSFAAANPDGFDHVRRPVTTRFAFEDQTGGGDRDFNDSVVEVQTQAAPQADVLSLTEPVKRK